MGEGVALADGFAAIPMLLCARSKWTTSARE
jgi:hypothetical protein